MRIPTLFKGLCSTVFTVGGDQGCLRGRRKALILLWKRHIRLRSRISLITNVILPRSSQALNFVRGILAHIARVGG